jgi:hypothetical protein
MPVLTRSVMSCGIVSLWPMTTHQDTTLRR